MRRTARKSLIHRDRRARLGGARPRPVGALGSTDPADRAREVVVGTRMPSRVLASLVLVAVALGALARRAGACPCCDPCHKYDHLLHDRAPVEVLADEYVAARATPMPAHPKRADVMRILTGVRFAPSTPGARTLRIVDAAHVPDRVDHRDAARIEIVHDLAARGGHFRITLAGVAYTVEPCRDGARHATTCLARVIDPPALAPAP
jgi:hypothetical protein